MNIKRLLAVIYWFVLLFVFIPSINVLGNSGPPSNLILTIENASFDYYFEILVYQETPLSESQMETSASSLIFNKDDAFDYYYEYPLMFDMPELLISFQDKDGYVSNTLYGGVPDFFESNATTTDDTPDRFTLWLGTPRIFKLILINDSNEVIISEVIEMKQYDYRLTWDLEGVTYDGDILYDQGVIKGFIGHPMLQFSTYVDFVIRLLVTLTLELSILFLFGFRMKKSYMIVLGINVISQSILTVVTLSAFYNSRFNLFAPIIYFVIGEFFVFIGEMTIFGVLLKEKPVYVRVIYAFIANLVSMIIGLMVTLFIFGNIIT